jgi:hypothetical protein
MVRNFSFRNRKFVKGKRMLNSYWDKLPNEIKAEIYSYNTILFKKNMLDELIAVTIDIRNTLDFQHKWRYIIGINKFPGTLSFSFFLLDKFKYYIIIIQRLFMMEERIGY